MENTNWVVEGYVKNDGTEPVEEFLNGLNKKDKAKMLRCILLLEEFGIRLNHPHMSYLGDGLLELRSKQSSNINRVIYFHYENGKFILLHGFTKKTQRTPRQEIEKAKNYREDYKNRNKGGV